MPSELLDPNPDIRQLFLYYNQRYFDSTLVGVEVKWSKRMKLCAGICSYEGHGGLCSIRLSEPLLKFRLKEDLHGTLLHEMIHAFLFVRQGDTDRESHGPIFQAHMKRINKATGFHISIYHTFHDEVEFHRDHWWQCNGECSKRPPFFGCVKRSMNRAPGPTDTWWAEHQLTCTGIFTKVKEPQNYKKKRKVDQSNTNKNTTTTKKKKRK